MKKFLMFLYVFIFLMFQTPNTISAHFNVTTLNFNFTQLSKYNLDTGYPTPATNFARTDIKSVTDYTLHINELDYFSHVFLWDENGAYIGFYNSPWVNDTGSKFLGVIDKIDFPVHSSVETIAFDFEIGKEIYFYEYDMFGTDDLLANNTFDYNLSNWEASYITWEASLGAVVWLNRDSNDTNALYLRQLVNVTFEHQYFITLELLNLSGMDPLFVGFQRTYPLPNTSHYSFEVHDEGVFTYLAEADLDFNYFKMGSAFGSTDYDVYMDNVYLWDATAYYGATIPEYDDLDILYRKWKNNEPTRVFTTQLSQFQSLEVYTQVWIRNIEEAIPNWLEKVGIGEGFGKILISFILVMGIIITFALLKAPKELTILMGLIGLFISVALGFLPSWIIFLVGIVIFGLIILGRARQ